MVRIYTREDELRDSIAKVEEVNVQLQNEIDKYEKDKKISLPYENHNTLTRQAAYMAVDKLKEKYPIAQLCNLLGISRSSYYKWLDRI